MQELNTVLPVYKPLGKTPLEVIRQLQKVKPNYQHVPIGYAGRLDPMAEGVLLLLLGDENRKRKTYEQLPKTYTFSLLCGIATDSYDLLGKITSYKHLKKTRNFDQQLASIIPSFLGTHLQAYPPYSAVKVKAKPLFYWARENKLTTINIPQKEITIYSLQLQSQTTIAAHALQQEVEKRVQLVAGDFRQAAILKTWQAFFTNQQNIDFPLYSFTIRCSSGTYVRSLCHEIGKKLAVPSTTFTINRTSVGNFTLKDCLYLF